MIECPIQSYARSADGRSDEGPASLSRTTRPPMAARTKKAARAALGSETR